MKMILILTAIASLFSCRSTEPNGEATKPVLVCPSTQMPNADGTECITPQFPTRARQKSLQKSR